MNKITSAVITAAGCGSRFLPLTKFIQKEMMPVVDKPVIQYVVDEAIESGCDDIYIITGKNRSIIENYFNNHCSNSKQFDCNNNSSLTSDTRLNDLAEIHFIDQKNPKGLGDAILCAKNYIDDNSFAVLLGDTICMHDACELPCIKQLINTHLKYNLPIIGINRVRQSKINDYGIIGGKLIKNNLYDIQSIVEKPSIELAPSSLGIIGRYILKYDIFDKLEQTTIGHGYEIQLSDALCKYNKLLGLIPRIGWYDIGDINEWIKSNLELLYLNDKYRDLVIETMNNIFDSNIRKYGEHNDDTNITYKNEVIKN